MLPNTSLHVRTLADGIVDRRAFLQAVPKMAAVGTALSWKGRLAVAAEELRRRGKSCILLYMRGAPSQFETFDPKPGSSSGGPTKAIKTAVADIRIAEGWERVAAQ